MVINSTIMMSVNRQISIISEIRILCLMERILEESIGKMRASLMKSSEPSEVRVNKLFVP